MLSRLIKDDVFTKSVKSLFDDEQIVKNKIKTEQ